MKISLVDIKRQHDVISEEVHETVQRLLDKGQYILGNEVELFEKKYLTI